MFDCVTDENILAKGASSARARCSRSTSIATLKRRLLLLCADIDAIKDRIAAAPF